MVHIDAQLLQNDNLFVGNSYAYCPMHTVFRKHAVKKTHSRGSKVLTEQRLAWNIANRAPCHAISLTSFFLPIGKQALNGLLGRVDGTHRQPAKRSQHLHAVNIQSQLNEFLDGTRHLGTHTGHLGTHTSVDRAPGY